MFLRLFSVFIIYLVQMAFLANQVLGQTWMTDTLRSSRMFTAPPGVTSITVELWGAGGTGGGVNTASNVGGGGGGGGGYTKGVAVPVTPGRSYNIYVGMGHEASSGADGKKGDSSTATFDGLTLVAYGGKGGTKGTQYAGFGGEGGSGETYKGGRGADGIKLISVYGGGGGSSAGPGGNGNNGIDSLGGIAVAGGGAGGKGQRNFGDGAPGLAPGGGGGGGKRTNISYYPAVKGGKGADGQVVISWTTCSLPTIGVGGQPRNQSIAYGVDLSFSVAASAPTELTYQWEVSTSSNAAWIAITDDHVYSGATSAILTLTKPPVSLSGNKYRCKVRGCDALQTAISDEASLEVYKAEAAITLGNLAQKYNGSSKAATVITKPEGLTVDILYNGSSLLPINAGTYSVTATIREENYQGSASGTLVLSKAGATVSLSNLEYTYAPYTPRAATVTSFPDGLEGISIKYFRSGAEVPADVIVNAGEYVVEVSLNNDNYTLVDAQGQLLDKQTGMMLINKASQTISVTVPAPEMVVYNSSFTVEAASSSGLPVSYISGLPLLNMGNVFTMTSGTGMGSITYKQEGNENYKPAEEIVVSVIAKKADQVITWANPDPIVYGAALDALQLNASALGGAQLAYAPGFDKMLNAGSHELTVYASETADYKSSSAKVSIVVNKAPAQIQLMTLKHTYSGSAKAAVVSTVPSGLVGVSISYKLGGVIVTSPVAAGNYEVEAVLANSNYEVAPVSGTLVIERATTAVTINVSDAIYDGQPHGGTAVVAGDGQLNELMAVTYTGSTKAGVSYSSDDAPTEAGDYIVSANYPENNNYLSSFGSQRFSIDQAVATISMTGLDKVYNGSSQGATVITKPEGLAVNVTYNNFYEVPVNAGSYEVLASLNNSNYVAANIFDRLFIDKAEQDIVWPTPTPIIYGTTLSSIQLNARSIGVSNDSDLGGLIYNPDINEILDAGSHTLNVTAAATNNYKEAYKTVTLVVVKAGQVIDFAPPGDKTFGDAPFSVSATASSGLEVSFSVLRGPVRIDGNTVTIIGAGEVVIRASQSGSDNYDPATDVDYSFKIGKAKAVISLGDLSHVYDGREKTVAVTLSPVGLSGVSITYRQGNASLVAPVNAGNYEVTVTLDDINYEAATAAAMLVISRAPTTTKVTVGDVGYDGQPHGGSAVVTGAPNLIQELTISYSGRTEAGVSFSGYETPTQAGEYTATASFAGDLNYLGSSGTRAFVIFKAVPTVTLEDVRTLFDGGAHAAVAIVNGVDDVIDDAEVTYSYVGTPNGAPENSYNSADAPVHAGSYKVNARFAGNSNYYGIDATANVRIFAIPTVSLSTPNPVAINNVSSIKATLGDDVRNVNWYFTSGPDITTGNMLNSSELNIKSLTPNVYSVYVTFEDGMGNPGYTSGNVYAVFYDPAAGFVTGGGWINSPVGAYVPNEALTGKAHFGFVSKYEKGKNIPTGNTEFQFQAGGMNFKSSEYEYLVVGGARAQFRGKGMINGGGSYGFMLSAVDENLLGSGAPDKFRIKIWDNNNEGKVVYDNQMDATEDALPTTAIGGGSIVIHSPASGGKKTNAIAADAYTSERTLAAKFNLKAFPNPSMSHFNIQVDSDNAESAIMLRVLDLNGRVIEVIQGAFSGQTYNIGRNYRPGVYLVEMIQGSQRSQTMLLKVVE